MAVCAVAPGALADPRSNGPRPPGRVLDESHVVTRRAQLPRDQIQPLVPRQQWPVVPGHVVGLLVQSGPQPWGATYGYWGAPATDAARDEYVFTFEGSSPWAIYFPSDGRGRNFMRAWSVPTPQGAFATAGVAMFGRDTANAWGLRGRAHLVDVEVNSGRGGQRAQPHFVITSARVLDTTRLAVSPEDALVALRLRFDRMVATLGGDVARARAEIRSRAGAVPEQVGVAPTWYDGPRTLVVTMTLTANAQQPTGPARTETVACPECPCTPQGCAPCVPCTPTVRTVVPIATTSIQVAARYTVDRAGRLTEETLFSPSVQRAATITVQRIGPPQVMPSPTPVPQS